MEFLSFCKNKIKEFYTDETGNVSIMFAFLVPVLLYMTMYFEGEMQAKYIQQQAQMVLDIATKGAATTGEAVKSNGAVFCTIPYNPSNPEHSGDHVGTKLIEKNAHTLPKPVADELIHKLHSGQIKGFDNPDLRAGGFVEMQVTLHYKPENLLFSGTYKFTVKSTSKCDADPNAI